MQAKLIVRRILSEVCYRTNVLRALQRFGKASGRQPWRVLTYHRVVDPEHEPLPVQPGMYVRPESFDRQMEYLATQCHVITIAELLRALAERTSIPEDTVVITFDDGWRDTYTTAFPILRDFNLPATVFLATAFVGNRELFWTDRVAHSLRTLRAAAQYRDRVLTLLGGTPDIPSPIKEALNVIIGGGPEVDLATRTDECIEQLKEAPPSARKQVVDTLRALTKEFSTVRLDRMFVTWDEVAEMAKEGIAFGSHSHNHYRMTELNAAQLRDELILSAQALHEHHLPPAEVFCYPGGYYDSSTQTALRERNIRYAAAVHHHNDFSANPALLGRINIHEDVTATAALFAFRIWTAQCRNPGAARPAGDTLAVT